MSTKISKGSIIASFIYEKSTNLKGYEEMDLLTISEVKKNDGYLGHELFNSNENFIHANCYSCIDAYKGRCHCSALWTRSDKKNGAG